ncbi:MAG: hypothetical protein U9Q22_01720 [Candidatus Altiarchaeota archaeon]|nr:hypothetical protein [Candidatus Altiarchaeota archaeon]
MKFQEVDQRIYAIKDRVKQENAGAHAEKLKTKAFRVLSRLLLRPREEDIEVTYIERRYENLLTYKQVI